MIALYKIVTIFHQSSSFFLKLFTFYNTLNVYLLFFFYFYVKKLYKIKYIILLSNRKLYIRLSNSCIKYIFL